ncbi:MAG: hypothetical protein M1833_004595 [Piccolia ochrophora]|nr:MAG: hypothetical protein M1833_004595 [Piccolia ochrophora]
MDPHFNPPNLGDPPPLPSTTPLPHLDSRASLDYNRQMSFSHIAPQPPLGASYRSHVPNHPIAPRPPAPLHPDHEEYYEPLTDFDPREEPTHVVGSQGRRGILPSAPGRAAVISNESSSAKSVMVPTKDADGVFHCPHCTKTYKHAKHLKRHHLRHTGDRPYMCSLCRDTFSRSDILKRHFQKCSIRRGNPTGAGHLTHAQAHLKKSGVGSSSSEGLAGSVNDSGPFLNGHGIRLMDDDSGQSSSPRAPNLKRPGDGMTRDQRSLTGPGPGGSNRASTDGRAAITLSSDMEQTMSAMSMPQSGGHPHHPTLGLDHTQGLPNGAPAVSNRYPYFDGSGVSHGNIDWGHLFQDSGDGMMSNVFRQGHPGDVSMTQKSETPMTNPTLVSSEMDENSIFNGLYPPTTLGPSGFPEFPSWNPQVSPLDPLQIKADQLIAFCFPDGGNRPLKSHSEGLRGFLTGDNTRHFAELVSNYLAHWPLLHMPTFDIREAYEGLVLAMICIGAVYSDRMNVSQVRQVMEESKLVVFRDLSSRGLIGGEGNNFAEDTAASPSGDVISIEELQALILFQCLFMWHGTHHERDLARRDFPKVVSLARKAELFRLAPPGHPSFSYLHHPDGVYNQMNGANWDWFAWVEQEKRSRAMFTVYLIDTASVLYFNQPPLLDSLEITLPLPADDAAWEAGHAGECADALGLNGQGAQQVNITGSRRAKQPVIRSALQVLMDPNRDFQPGSTNAYSKFILVHALHVQIWTVQKYLSPNANATRPGDKLYLDIAVDSAQAQDDWVAIVPEDGGSATTMSPNGSWSGNEGTNTSVPKTQQMLKATNNALAKWKRAWDADMAIQYPPTIPNLRRRGFCRDGVHFYWLARAILRNQRVLDWRATPDARLWQVFSLLKKVKQYVASESAQRGEEMGSVGDIDDKYGVEELTLDMKLLFKPLSNETDSPGHGVQAGLGSGVF